MPAHLVLVPLAPAPLVGVLELVVARVVGLGVGLVELQFQFCELFFVLLDAFHLIFEFLSFVRLQIAFHQSLVLVLICWGYVLLLP